MLVTARARRADREVARRLIGWYLRNRRDLPWRLTRHPYRVWVSEVMLQQTTVPVAIPYYRRFLRRFPTLSSLAGARLPEVLALWSGLGYYRRARHLHAAARRIVARHGGRFPRDRASVLALPGIGPSTAGAVLSIAFGLPEPVVDGNVARVLSRLLRLRGDPRRGPVERRIWNRARALVEGASSPGDLNQALMELGALVCTPRSPACHRCPVQRACRARAAGDQETIPPPRDRRSSVTIRLSAALVERRGRYLVRRRNGTDLMDGLWEFPALGDPLRIRSLGRIARVRHSITFRRFLVDVHRARMPGEPRGGGYRWVRPAALRRMPVSSLVAKILEAARV